MSILEKITAATADDYASMILNNDLFALVRSGKMTPTHYVAYLQQTYHLVRHTPRMLSLGGARLPDERRELRNWFFDQVEEENGHDLFCIKDLQNLGFDAEKILSGSPERGAWGLVTQNYFMATYGNPVGILGVASATEGLGAELGSIFSNLLIEKYELNSNATTFLRSHGGFDARHLEEAGKALELIHENELSEVIHARRMTLQFYGQMFLDVRRLGDQACAINFEHLD